jgi:hypothetical protein
MIDDHLYPRPRPCHVLLHRTWPKAHSWNSDFRGEIALEDGRRYQIGVTVLADRDGEQMLSIYLRPLHLYKTSVVSGRGRKCT